MTIIGFLPMLVSYYLFKKVEPMQTRVVQVVPARHNHGAPLSTISGDTLGVKRQAGDGFDTKTQIDAEDPDLEDNAAVQRVELAGPEPADPPLELANNNVPPCCNKYTYCDICICCGCGTVVVVLLLAGLQLDSSISFYRPYLPPSPFRSLAHLHRFAPTFHSHPHCYRATGQRRPHVSRRACAYACGSY